MELPKSGIPKDELFETLRARKVQDANWRAGRTWSLIYPAGEDVDDVLVEANRLYVFENALNPFKFPSLRQMEDEVVAMTASLLHGPAVAGGAITSGGTESILMAVKVARERARVERGITKPELLAPHSAHPAFAKAAHYLGLKHVQIPLRNDFRADVDAARGLITDQTALVVGSAPGYPHGVIDPIEELAGIAEERGVPFHTDACVGGFMLPFLEKLGYKIPLFDFRIPGVSSISADVHKYGYATKGASIITHRSAETMHKHQLFLYEEWPGGLYGSFAMAGARPAAPIAAAWSVMNYLGWDGYLRLSKQAMETTLRLWEGIEAIAGLKIWSNPDATLLAFGSNSLDIMAIGDVMDQRGWHLDRQKNPDALHMMVTPNHEKVIDEFLSDLRFAAENHGESEGKDARYS